MKNNFCLPAQDCTEKRENQFLGKTGYITMKRIHVCALKYKIFIVGRMRYRMLLSIDTLYLISIISKSMQKSRVLVRSTVINHKFICAGGIISSYK